MSQTEPRKENLSEEFRNLGENLVGLLRAVWETPERQDLQQEIESGISELSKTVKTEVDSFSESPTGQRLKSDMEAVNEKIRSGETQEKIRNELLQALKTINDELKKASSRWSEEQEGAGQPSEIPDPEQPADSPQEG
jgi:gas vesicle protein